MVNKSTTLAEDYLAGRDGDVTHFYKMLAKGQRLGQAFYNALSDKDRERLNGTMHDCYNATRQDVLWETIGWLLDWE
jgi:hypothetical protein